MLQGLIQDFNCIGGGGGAQNIMYAQEHHECVPDTTYLTAGVQGPLKGPRSSRVFFCAVVPSKPDFFIILVNGIKKNHSRSTFIVVRACCAPCMVRYFSESFLAAIVHVVAQISCQKLQKTLTSFSCAGAVSLVRSCFV